MSYCCLLYTSALVDEVDSILIDESRTPLIISGGKKNTAALYIQADKFVKSLREDKDYEVDIESKTVALTAEGISKAEKAFKIKNLYDPEHTALVHHINQALKANYTMSLNVEYMIATEDGSHDIRNASIMIIDQFTAVSYTHLDVYKRQGCNNTRIQSTR